MAGSPHEQDSPVPLHVPPGLDPDNWARAGRRLLVKMLAEFAYEGIIEPEREPGTPPAANPHP
ncbi:hypothetical protein KDA82_38275, partial [Streptomyces daliensis]|nr:hypothetical protein [Streptomyces daliensis]